MSDKKAGNVAIIDDDTAASSGGADSLGHTNNTVLVREYDNKDAAIIKLFFDEELTEIASVGLVNLNGQQGPGQKLIITCLQSKKAEIDPLIKDLDKKRDSIEERDATVPSDAFAKLAEYMRSEEERQKDAPPHERVLYRPDIVNKNVQVYFWPGNDNAVIKLKHELGTIETGGTRNRNASSDQAAGRAEPGDRLYPVLTITVPNDKALSHSLRRTVSLEQTRHTDDNYEEMECEPYALPWSDAFVKDFSRGFRLLVYNKSILQLPVDAIVNAANNNMVHGGGVAQVISEAAGKALDTESWDHVKCHGLLPVSKNIVTTAGRLKYKGVIHAVGPQWHEYKLDKVGCLDHLYDTIQNILETCEEKGYRTVAMPAISAGIYGVPKELCADMYVKAAADYSMIAGRRLPEELHIVDIDQEILDYVKTSVQKYEKDPKSIDQRVSVPIYLKRHPQSSGGRNRGQRHGLNRDHGSSQDRGSSQAQGHSYGPVGAPTPELIFLDIAITCEVKKLQEEKFKWGGIAQHYTFNKELSVKIFKGDITKSANVDGLVCGIGPDLKFTGYIAEALKQTGGPEFENKLKKTIEKAKQVKLGDVLTSKPGKLKVKNVVFVVTDKLLDVGKTELVSYRDWVNNLLTKAHDWSLKKIVMPLFSTGMLQTNENKLQKCAIALVQALDKFVDYRAVKNINVKEIHLVNNNDVVTSTLVKVFDAASKSYGHNASRTTSSGSDTHPGGGRDAGHGQATNQQHGSYPHTNQQGGSYPHTNQQRGSYPHTNQQRGSYPHTNQQHGSYPHTNQQRGSYPQTKDDLATGYSGFKGSFRSEQKSYDNSSRKTKFKKVGLPNSSRDAWYDNSLDGSERCDSTDGASAGARGGANGSELGSRDYSDDEERSPHAIPAATSRPAQPSPPPAGSTSTQTAAQTKGNLKIIIDDDDDH